jgi:predicted lipid-binding transport protein (Tim44 family)
MRFLVALLSAGAIAAALLPSTSEAARVGSGRSFGVQRAAPPAQRAAPSQQQAPQQAQKAAPAPQQQPAAGNRWLGPLAGLAAGLGLGWLLSQGGFGGMLGTMLLALLVGVAVFALVRLFARSRGAQPQYAPQGAEPVLMNRDAGAQVTPPMSAGLQPGVRGQAPVLESEIVLPQGFDAAAFIRQAKLNFIRLQEANDQRDLEALREVTTEPMYASIVADLPSGPSSQPTDVVNLDASLLELTTEGENHWASVRFQGTIREDGREAAPFHEVWHLQKPVSGSAGWLLAGIQQVS